MSIQARFRTFHELIQLTDVDENSTLREKRDIVLARLRERVPRSFTPFNQGSYAMGTGVVPREGDYDIDVGIVFDFSREAALPAVRDVKGPVHAALVGHTSDVQWKTPCVTVQYVRGGAPSYHVDLAIYGQDRYGVLHLARGREHAADQRWEPSDPKGLITSLKDRFAGEDAAQARRIVRYLKRWRDVQFPPEGRSAPVGIGLTLLVYDCFRAVRDASGQQDDLAALALVVTAICGRAMGGRTRLQARVPVRPHDDVFARMSDEQHRQLGQRFEQLRGWLEDAGLGRDPGTLKRAFGPEFPA